MPSSVVARGARWCAPRRAREGSVGGDSVDWVRVRSPQRDQDRVLQSPTHVWLRRIPSAIHPKHLCRYYPRIANRLAMAWGDKTEVEEIFEDLLQDRRGQRKGFSERVRVEIERGGWLHGCVLAAPLSAEELTAWVGILPPREVPAVSPSAQLT